MPLRLKRISIAIALVGIALMALAIKEARSEPMWTSLYGGTDGYCGQLTSSGEVYDCQGFTAASSFLPYGSVVRVSYAGRSVDVRVNDTCACPLDISLAAADVIGLPGADVAEVTVL